VVVKGDWRILRNGQLYCPPNVIGVWKYRAGHVACAIVKEKLVHGSGAET
jgi:hypothetical protein